jgi:hypothetical protein
MRIRKLPKQVKEKMRGFSASKRNIALVGLLGTIVVASIIVSPLFLAPPSPEIFNGDLVLTESLIIRQNQHLILQNGFITGATPEIHIEVHDRALLEGIDVTIKVPIYIHESGRFKMTDSPHTVGEIYAYNNAVVEVINSTVLACFLFDSARLLIDGESVAEGEATVYTDLQLAVSEINDTLNEVYDQLLIFNYSMSVLNTTSATNAYDIVTLLNTVSNLMDELARLNTILTGFSEVESVQDAIDSLSSALIVIEGDLQIMTSVMFTNDTTLQNSINVLNTTLLSLEGQLNGLEPRITTLENTVYEIYNIMNLTLPSVAILHPNHYQTVSGNISLQSFILEPYVDSVTWTANDTIITTSEDIHIWDTTIFIDGLYNLTVSVTNIFGRTVNDSIFVDINNTAPIIWYKIQQVVSQTAYHATGGGYWEPSGILTFVDIQYYNGFDFQTFMASITCQQGAQLQISFSLSVYVDGTVFVGAAIDGIIEVYTLASANGINFPISMTFISDVLDGGTYNLTLQSYEFTSAVLQIRSYTQFRFDILELIPF